MNWFDINGLKIKGELVEWIDMDGDVQMANTLNGVLAEYIELKRLQQDLYEHIDIIKEADK